VTDIAVALPVGSRPSSAVRAGRYIKDHLIYVYMALAIAYLMLPVAVMALFSFNDPPGKSRKSEVQDHQIKTRVGSEIAKARQVRQQPR